MPAKLRRPTDDNAHRAHHCPQREYESFIRSISRRTDYAVREMAMVRRFTSRWPALQDWFEEPLYVRVGVERLNRREATDARISSDARPYLLYLALRDNVRFDYPWLLTAHMLYLPTKAAEMGMDIGLDGLIADALGLGYRRTSTQVSVTWPLTRILLRTGLAHAGLIRAEHVTEFDDAVRAFLASPLLAEYYPQSVNMLNKFRKTWLYRVNQFKLLMFHRGQFPTQPASSCRFSRIGAQRRRRCKPSSIAGSRHERQAATDATSSIWISPCTDSWCGSRTSAQRRMTSAMSRGTTCSRTCRCCDGSHPRAPGGRSRPCPCAAMLPLLANSSGTQDRGAGLVSLRMPSSVRVTSRGSRCGFRASSRMLNCNA